MQRVWGYAVDCFPFLRAINNNRKRSHAILVVPATRNHFIHYGVVVNYAGWFRSLIWFMRTGQVLRGQGKFLVDLALGDLGALSHGSQY